MPETAVKGVARALNTVRSYLGMDVAFISEFVGDRRVFRHVDTNHAPPVIAAGDAMSLKDGYCQKVVDGHLPELIPNTAAVPAAMEIGTTHDLPIGAHLSVPLRLSDGRIYGTFCCFSFKPDPSLNERDLRVLRAFADLVAHQIEGEVEQLRSRSEMMDRIRGVLASPGPAIVYQPIFRLSDLSLNGAEALARFEVEPRRSPDLWFAEAGEVKLKAELEELAIRNALAGFRSVWREQTIHLGLNCSPQTIVAGNLPRHLGTAPPNKVVLEVTEHDAVQDYERLRQALKPLKAIGVKVAIDDAGAGFASLRHIVDLRPDIIKLDISLVRGIHADTMKQALAHAFISFGRQTDCKIVAEGVENAAELAKVRELGVDAAQGFFLGRPGTAEALAPAAV